MNIWYAMKLIDIKKNVKGFGRLMAILGAQREKRGQKNICQTALRQAIISIV
jgi:hypothetical protein